MTKSFSGDKGTDVTLAASTGGINFGVDLSADDQLKEVRASRSVSVGDQTLDVEPSFLVKAQKARVKLASAFGLRSGVTAMLLLTASLPIIDDSDMRAGAMDNKTKTARMLMSASMAKCSKNKGSYMLRTS